METHATGINKPRILVGLDKRLFVFVFLLACGILFAIQAVAGFVAGVAMAGIAFGACCVAGRKLTTSDPQLLSLAVALLRQPALYDIGLRDNSRVVIEGR